VHALDNPFWSALASDQASLAVAGGGMRWFPADVAPFCAVEREGQPVDAESLHAAMAGCGMRYFVGVLPALPAGFSASDSITLLQMAGAVVPHPRLTGRAVRALGPGDVDAMLALTGLVFPGFFRRRTLEMGRYLGIFDGPALVAMGGERLALPGYRELSGISTHPAHTGRGHARTIVGALASRTLAEGRIPFLHVRDTNARARRLYESSGLTVVNTVRLLTVTEPTLHAEPWTLNLTNH
jgi:ribosomal protein S18 acetylase RimI-like enzyme